MFNIYFNDKSLADAAAEYWNKGLKKYRLVGLIGGIVLCVLGVLCLLFPFTSTAVMGYIASAAILVTGILSIIEYFRMPVFLHSAALLVPGIINVIVGILLLTSTKENMIVVFAFVIAFELLITGIEELSSASRLKYFGDTGYGWLIASGVISIVIAIIFMFLPRSSVAISVLVGIYLLAGGISLIVAAVKAKELKVDHSQDVIDVK